MIAMITSVNIHHLLFFLKRIFSSGGKLNGFTAGTPNPLPKKKKKKSSSLGREWHHRKTWNSRNVAWATEIVIIQTNLRDSFSLLKLFKIYMSVDITLSCGIFHDCRCNTYNNFNIKGRAQRDLCGCKFSSVHLKW